MDTPAANAVPIVRHYLSLLLASEGRRVALVLGSTLLSSGLSGGGVLLLVPVLQVVGLPVEPTGFVAQVTAVLGRAGLTPSLGGILPAFLAVVVAHALLSRGMALLTVGLEHSFTRALEQRVYVAVMHTDWLFFLRHRNSDLNFALTRNVRQVSGGTLALLRMASTLVITAVHVGLCVAIAPGLAGLILGCFAVFWLTLARYDRRVRQTGQQVVALSQRLYGHVMGYLDGMKEAKSVGAERRQLESFSATTDAIREASVGFARMRENTALVYRVGSAAVVCLVVYVAVEILRFPVVELTLVVVITSRLLPRLRGVHGAYQSILHMLPAFESLQDLLDSCDAAHVPLPGSSPDPLPLRQAVTLRDVSFRYDDGRGLYALREVDLRIPTGATVAIVGPSGAGKTTLADLLMGLLRPTHGELEVDGAPLTAETVHRWRRSIGYVPQDTFMLHDTLRANLLWAAPDATDAAIQAALRLAAADEVVAALPDGLDTIVGDRGLRLSGGERQRVALARALLRQPTVLILDEATSSLDAENQRRIQEAIRRLHGNITIVIIAHRLSTVRIADQVVVLEAGRVVEQGDYAELASRRTGRFREMIELDLATA